MTSPLSYENVLTRCAILSSTRCGCLCSEEMIAVARKDPEIPSQSLSSLEEVCMAQIDLVSRIPMMVRFQSPRGFVKTYWIRPHQLTTIKGYPHETCVFVDWTEQERTPRFRFNEIHGSLLRIAIQSESAAVKQLKAYSLDSLSYEQKRKSPHLR